MRQPRDPNESSAALEEAFHRAEQHSPLRAIAHLARTARHSTPRGALAGLHLVIKDNIHVAGMPASAGTPALTGHIPDVHAPVVERLLAAGATVLGKTTMHELAFGATCDTTPLGPVRNACDPARSPGGSSGGTAVAIAAGIVPAGLGTDTGGSIRVPAALNGVCGLRPTTGRYPGQGVVPLSPTRDTVGPLARTVAELAKLDAVLASEPPVPLREPDEVRLGVPRTFFTADLDTEVGALWRTATERLTAAGVVLVPVDVARITELSTDQDLPIVAHEAGTSLRAYLGEHVPHVSFPSLVESIAAADVRSFFVNEVPAIEPTAYRSALRGRPELQSSYAEVFTEDRVDALVFPTTPAIAQDLSAAETFAHNGREVPTFATFVRNCGPGSIAGLPGLTVPMGRSDAGVPAGLALDGPAGSDRRLLDVGAVVERILGQAQNSRN